jgi:hypothetical protein
VLVFSEQSPDIGTERSAPGSFQRDLVDSERRYQQASRVSVQRVLKCFLQKCA